MCATLLAGSMNIAKLYLKTNFKCVTQTKLHFYFFTGSIGQFYF